MNRTRRLIELAAFVLVVTAAAPAAPLPALRVSDNHRFLVTDDGKPFFWLGDTAWELFHRLNREETERYLADRAAKGFNVIQAVALAELDGLTVPNPQGHLPFLDKDLSRPDVKEGPDNDYWDDIEWTLHAAERKGLYVGLLPMWGKYRPADTGNCEGYGRFIGERFKDHSNIIWILGGDRPAPTKQDQDAWRAMARGIAIGVSGREDYDRVLMTYHTFGPDNASKYFPEDIWLDLYGIQSSHGDRVLNWKMIEQEYQRRPIKPVIDLETTYPDVVILKGMKPGNDDNARRSAYWAVFSGACGHTYGHNSIWQMYALGRKPILNPRSYWFQALNAPSAAQMGYLRGLIESRPFLTQSPDQSLMANGEGDDLEHVAALRGEGYALIYTPTGKPFRVRLDKLTGKQMKAWWFDPRTGKATAAGQFAKEGEREFTPPGSPGVGHDWVLALDDATKDLAAPGTKAYDGAATQTGSPDGTSLAADMRAASDRIVFPEDPSVMNVKRDFGAVGDGVANDTAALQAGIEASCGRGGSTKILFVPNGTYRVTNTLVVRSGVGPWVYGESRDGVVIRLTDDVPTNITSVLRTHPSDTQASSADFFMRNFRNFTIDVGDNPTVDGIRWYGNNSSALQNVRVAGTGHIGVNSGFLGQNGPNLIQDVTVEGSFETGIRCAWSWGQTLSRVTVRHARHEGVYVNATAVGIEDLVVEDTPVALRNEYPNTWTWWGGVVALVGGRFTGSDPSQPAITNTSVLYARNVTASGFKQVLQSTTSGGSVTGSRLEEYCSHPVQKLFPDSPDASFKLPILPEPGVPWETNLANWVCANTYGAAYGDGKDDTAAIQAAIYAAAAAGKTVVYLRGIGGSDPNCYNVDGEIRVHGSARQIIALGFGRIIGGPEGRFVVDDASAPRVKFQHLQAFGGTPCVVENRSAHNTLMVESCDMKVLGTGTGDIFLTDCPSHVELRSPGQRLWARQLNPEGDSDRGLVQNHGGRLWALGVKHEGRGVRWLTEDGGQTEILGLFNYAPDIAATDLRPEFDVSNACFCAMGVWEISFGNTFPVKVRETRLGDTRTEKGGGWIGWALYSGWSPSVTNAEAADLQNRIFDHSNPPRPPGPGTGNITFPTNSGVIDVTAAPYLAKGDGIADDTQSIQSALNDHPNEGAIIYLPNGTYLISQTLRWPRGRGGGSEYKNTILQGQSSAGTVIRLKDACPGFTDPAKPAEMVWTGGAPAQRFRNAIRNLTFDTGRGNPNAIGVRFDASNVGCLRDTVIRSGDGSGVIGLDQSYADDFGPCFVKNVTVIGFDTGIAVAHGVNGIVYENITLRGQRKMGWENRGMPITIRNLVSENSVTALRNVEWYGLVTLVDAQLTGTGAASALPAIDRQAGGLFARNLTVSGYACAIQSEDKAHPETVPGPRVAEWVSSGRLPGSGEHSLGLPVEETPDVPWDDPKDWAVITDYGAKMDGHSDDSDALQAAIDSGKTTVCLPRGTVVLKKPIVLRGSVRRLIGCEASLKFPTPMTGAKNIFTVGESPEPVLVVERFASWFWDNHSGLNFIDNPTKRTLVLRELGDVDDTSDQHPNGHGTIISGPGDLFIEDVTGRFQLQPGTHAWMRYVNPETNQDHRNTAPEAQWHLQNDGGQLWILGIKTEGPGPVIITRDGGATELLGGLMYSSGGARTQEQPAFIVADSRASFTITEANFGHNAYPVLVRQLRDGQVVFKLKPGQTPSGPGGSMIPLWSTP